MAGALGGEATPQPHPADWHKLRPMESLDGKGYARDRGNRRDGVRDRGAIPCPDDI